MQSKEYKEALIDVLRKIDEINGIILTCLVNISMQNEFKEV
jgi:hypothetical protein